MVRKTFKVQLVTPCFLGGASGTAEWRAASIRGHLRWWFRAVAGACHRGALEPVRSAETALFGSTNQGSALRIRTGLSPEPLVAGSRFGNQQSAADLAALWGDTSPATQDRLRLGRTPEQEWLSNPVHYLGFGPIVGAQSERPCLPAGAGVEFQLQWNRSPENELLRLFDQALWAWLNLGGIGSRSRKGFGSLQLVQVQKEGTPEAPSSDFMTAPADRTGLIGQARSLLALGRQASGDIPEWTHFSRRSRIFVAVGSDPTWEQAMTRLGAWLIGFRRRYGYPKDSRTAGGLPLANRDYEWAAPGGGLRRQDIPDRSGFGLPLPFGKHETVVWDSPDGDARRASPLLLHVSRLDGGYVPVLTYLPARFLPSGRRLLFRGHERRTFGPTPQVLDVVDRFLDDLLAKERIDEVTP